MSDDVFTAHAQAIEADLRETPEFEEPAQSAILPIILPILLPMLLKCFSEETSSAAAARKRVEGAYNESTGRYDNRLVNRVARREGKRIDNGEARAIAVATLDRARSEPANSFKAAMNAAKDMNVTDEGE